ncbi:glycosyl hydrolase family 3 C-terminal domain-containing protein, partial [Fusarium oxysporum f. sp. albedinis]
MRIYTSPPTIQPNNSEITDTREAIDVLQLNDSNVVLYDYSNAAAPDNVVYATITADLVVEKTDTYAFSLTVAGTATLYLDNALIVDNSHDQKRGTSFFGSGSVEQINHVQLVANRVYKLRVEFGSAATSNLNKAGAPVFGAGGVRIGCARCSNESLELDRAVELAKTADQVVVCVGLGPEWESEGSDRSLYELPGRQCELISRVAAVNKHVVVIIQSGTPVSGPWDQVAAVMQTWYGGNELGHGIADIVLGRESPSGKLPLSWPRCIEDNPSFLSYRSEAGACNYNEDIFVGYRFYEKTKRKVQWPFGFGLSYASFILQQPSVQLRGSGVDANILVTLSVCNNSATTSGKEVIQVYMSRITPSSVSRPVKELKRFAKLFVAAGETRLATVEIPLKNAVSVWDVTTNSWLLEEVSSANHSALARALIIATSSSGFSKRYLRRGDDGDDGAQWQSLLIFSSPSTSALLRQHKDTNHYEFKHRGFTWSEEAAPISYAHQLPALSAEQITVRPPDSMCIMYTHEMMAPAAAQPDSGNLTSQTSTLSVPLQSPDSSQRDETNGSQPSPPSDSSAFGDASLQQHQDQPHRNLYQDFTQSHWDAVLQRPTDHTRRSTLASQGNLHQPEAFYFPFPLASEVTVNDLKSALPPRESCEYLIIRYFTCISPFFHILHGPTFQKQFAGFLKDTSSCDLSWLALLFLICSATLKTIDKGDDVIDSIASSSSHSPNIAVISDRYRAMAMICLCKDRFLVRYRLSTLEALLVLVYTISHNEGAEQSWVILGMASNIGIALQCNAAKPDPNLTLVERERRRRCWAGILLLHTYQAILFRDVDMSSLISDYTTMPENVNDTDILHDRILQPSTQPTQMSVMIFKISLFRLSARICKELSDATPLTQARLVALDAEIASEQQRWASIFLVDGAPSLLDSSSYALWCGLDVYAHQLYLLLHRPFSRPANQPLYRPESRQKCITSSLVLLDIHRKWMELPRLSSYRWYAYGVVGSCALHGAVTLASCLLERTDQEIDDSAERKAFDAAVLRLNKLQERSSLYVKAYPVLRQLQSMLSPGSIPWSSETAQEFGTTFDDWIDNVQWLDPESIDWNFWDEILKSG